MSKQAAREKLMRAVIRRLGSERDEPNAHFDDELDLCNDMIDEAARELVAVEEGS